MKTIEQKAKRYDEALKAAIVAHKDEDRHLKATLERIFHELKESEDEKVRKSLKDCIEWLRDDARWTDVYGSSFESVFAYLEKQGEKDEEILVLKDQIESLLAAREALIEVHKIEIEKQGEQKPAEHTDLRTWKYIVDAVLTEREGIGQYLDSPWTTEVAEKLQKGLVILNRSLLGVKRMRRC